MAKVHFMSWACQDWLSSPLRGELAIEGDLLTRVVYRDLLDILHERGGYLLKSEAAGACLVAPKDGERAVERLLQSGRIKITPEGMLYNERVLEGLKEREDYVATKSEAGKRSAQVRKERTGTAQPPNSRRTRVREVLNIFGTPSEPSVSVPSTSSTTFSKKERTMSNPSASTVDVFGHWATVMDHPNARLDNKRRKLIDGALKLGYTVEDLKKAIDGYKLSPFHRGENDRKQVYDGLDLIFRDADKIDKGIAYTRDQWREAPSKAAPMPWSQEAIEAQDAARAAMKAKRAQ